MQESNLCFCFFNSFSWQHQRRRPEVWPYPTHDYDPACGPEFYRERLELFALAEREQGKTSRDEAIRRWERLPNPENGPVSGWRDWVMCRAAMEEARHQLHEIR